MPVLLMRPQAAGAARSFTCQHLLIPLDGQAEHEQALTVAKNIASACGSALHLVLVVPTRQTLSRQRAATAKFLPSATAAILDMTLEGGQEYLNGLLSQLRAKGFPSTAFVLRGDPARRIVATADSIEADLIVLATHRKKGAEAFWSQSVAPQVSSDCDRPLLLVPLR
jgi:nucleotide-binding universal stress UspA family protein